MAKDQEKNEGAWATKTDEHRTDFTREKGGAGSSLAALALWVLGIACEVFGVLVVAGKLDLGLAVPLRWVILLVCVVVAAAACLTATRIWSAAAKKTGKRGTSNVAVALSSASFVPMAFYFLVSKNAAASTKAVACVAAAVVVIAIVAACVLL